MSAQLRPTAPTVGTGPDRPGGPRAWLVWLLATTFVVWVFGIQTAYAVISPDIQVSAHLTLAQIGLAGSTYTWVFAVAQFFSGSLLDRFGSWPVLAAAVTLVTVGAFLYAGTTGLWSLVLAQVVLATGASFGFVGAGYIGGSWFAAARYGLMFGLVQSFASLGSAVGQPVVLAVAHAVDWRQLVVALAAFGVVLAVLFAVFVRDRPAAGQPRSTTTDGPFAGLGRCLRNPRVLVSAAIAGASFGTMLSLGTLWGPRLLEARGMPGGYSTVLTAVAWLGLALGAPVVNVVSDRWRSRKRPAVVALTLQGVAVALVITLPTQAAGAALVLMFAVGFFSGVQMLGFTIAGESVAHRFIGTASAIVNGLCFALGGLLIALPGALLPPDPSRADFEAALTPLPVVIALGVVTVLFLREPTRPPDKESV